MNHFAWLRLLGYVTVTSMTFDKPSSRRRVVAVTVAYIIIIIIIIYFAQTNKLTVKIQLHKQARQGWGQLL